VVHVVRSRARATISALACLLVVAGLSQLTASPAQAVSPPTGLSPSGGASVAGIPVLSWDRVDATSKYDVQVAVSDTFSTTLVSISNTANHQYVPTKQLPSQQLYWRVRVNGSGENWSDVATFGRDPVAGPALLGPADGADMVEPEAPAVLSWTPIPGADNYEVQIGTDPNFVDQTTTKDTESTSYVPGLQLPTTYYWRVRAEMSSGFFTQWSTSRSYDELGVRGPTGDGLYPTDDPLFNVQDVVLDWAPIKGAKTYDLQIGTDDNFLTIEHQRNGIVGTRYSPPNGLPNDQYFWRIRPVDASGHPLDWTTMPAWRFKRNWPDQPELLYPAAGANVGDPFYFQWTPVEHATSYTVYINGTSGSGACTTVHTTLTKGHGGGCFPGAYGSYTWHVVANDATKDWDIPTVALDAETRAFNYTPTLVPQVAPASGATVAVPTMRWSAVSGAAKYKVSWTAGGTTRSATTASLSYTPHGLDPGTYRWDVQTVRRTGELGAARTQGSQPTFVVPAPVAGTATNPNPTPASVGASYRFPTLQWESVAGADHYNLYVRPAGGAGYTLVGDDFEFPAGEDTSSTFLTAGDYQWYVEAYSNSNSFISQGSVGTFTIKALSPVTVYDAAITGNALTGNAGTTVDSCDATLPATCQNLRQTPVLGWQVEETDSLANVGYYLLTLSRDSELTNEIFTIAVDSTLWIPEDALADSQAGSAYFWSVRPCTADGHCTSAAHADHSFNKQSRQQTLVSPADGATVQNDVTLTWDDYLDSQSTGIDSGTPLNTPGQVEAAWYRVQTSPDPGFNTNVTTSVVEQKTFTAYASTLPEGTNYWRVQAIDGTENNLAFSPVRSFVKQSPGPVLNSPAPGAEVAGDSALSWTPLDFAASYIVEIYKNDDTLPNPANRVVSAGATQVGYVLDSLDPSLGPYRWRVQRVDASGRPGSWSELRQFKVRKPEPTLVSPVADALVEPSDSLFTWQQVTGATNYKFERRVANSSSVTEAVTTAALAWAPTAAIAGGSWQWRVSALDTSGHALGSSPWTSFTVVDTPVATTPVSISGSGAVGTTLTLNPPIWNMPPGTVTTTYQWYRGSGAIAGETGVTYVVTAADVGKAITVRATGTRTGYKVGTSTSNAITGANGAAITAQSPPTVTGNPAAKETLTADTGSWPGSPTYAYQWFVNGVAVAKETKNAYVVRTRDAGLPVNVRVTATTAGYQPGTAFSTPLTVAKLSSTTAASLTSKKITQRDRAEVNVAVALLDLGVTLGQVQVMEGSKVLGTVGLQTGKDGEVTIRLKKLKKGKHKLTVTYLGSASTLPSTAKTLTLKVVKPKKKKK